MKKILCIAISFFVCMFICNSIYGQSKRRTKKLSIMSREQALYVEGYKLAKKYWDNTVTDCGGSYFIYTDERLFESKNKPYWSFDGDALQPKSLSRADILNGIDPLPVEWQGNTCMNFSVYRMNTAYYGYGQTYWHGWGDWMDRGSQFCAYPRKKKGVWSGFDSPPKKITCSEIPR
ncbi:MAG: hypothetical protein ACR2N3_18935 [Pyrinomonadaceae bacterium]